MKFFKNLFGSTEPTPTVAVESIVETLPEPTIEPTPEVIDSKHVKKNIHETLESLLESLSVERINEDINNCRENIKKIGLERGRLIKANLTLRNKIDQYEALGLTNTPTITKTKVELEEELVKLKEAEDSEQEQIKAVEADIKYKEDLVAKTNEYAVKYPGYKFVPEKVMIDVMKRYDLWSGPSSLYSKEIPQNNLDAIFNWKDKIDQTKDVQFIAESTYRTLYEFSVSEAKTKLRHIEKVYNEFQADPELHEELKRLCKHSYESSEILLRSGDEFDNIKAYIKKFSPKLYKAYSKDKDADWNEYYHRYLSVKSYAFDMFNKQRLEYAAISQLTSTDNIDSLLKPTGIKILHSYESSALEIIAPKSHFTLPMFEFSTRRHGTPKTYQPFEFNEDTRIIKYSAKVLEELNTELREILDPIATFKVPGGRMVITAWDEEANIPEIQNPLSN